MRVIRGRTTRLLAVAALAAVAAACVPVTPPPPPPPPPAPPPPPQLAAPPPTIALPQPAPTLTPVDFAAGDRIWDIAFRPGFSTPDSAMLYTENDTGKVKAYISSGETGRELIDIADVNGSGEGGLMGIAVHPTQPWVYVCYSSTIGGDNRVVRYTLAVDGSNVPTGLSGPVDIVTGMLRANIHNGCRIRFQPGSSPSALFVTMGDAAVGSSPQNAAGLNGKVLRVDESGNAYSGNTSGQRWFTRGHRNPQGITFRPGTNVPYSAEHGPNINDEINALVNGGNSGWDPVPGYNQGVPMTDIAKFPTAIRPRWRSGDTRTIAPSGLEFLQDIGGSSWEAWNGFLVSAQLKDSELRLYRVDGAGNITGQVQIFANGARLRVPALGPDGKLYVANDLAGASGRIIQITPS